MDPVNFSPAFPNQRVVKLFQEDRKVFENVTVFMCLP